MTLACLPSPLSLPSVISGTVAERRCDCVGASLGALSSSAYNAKRSEPFASSRCAFFSHSLLNCDVTPAGSELKPLSHETIGKLDSDLPATDAYLYEELPRAAPDALTLAQLERVMKYKLTRGKFRPLLRLLLTNSDAEVRTCTANGLRILRGKKDTVAAQSESSAAKTSKTAAKAKASAAKSSGQSSADTTIRAAMAQLTKLKAVSKRGWWSTVLALALHLHLYRK